MKFRTSPAKAQRRKGKIQSLLCAFAPLRENSFVTVKGRIRLKLALTLSLLTFLPFSLFPFSPLSVVEARGISTATREGRLAVFDDAWETIRARYYDSSMHGVDWDAQRERYRPLAADARDAAEFYATLRRMIGSLRDAHTRIYAPDEKSDWRRPRHINVGIYVREVSGEPVIVRVERNSEAERAGLHAGDVIKSIDGEPALKVFQRRLDEQTASSTITAARLRAMATLFDGVRDSFVRVNWTGGDGKERAVTLKREWRERELSLSARKTGDYGLIAFDIFTPETAVDFFRALKGDLRGVRGLVIDLRANGGGDAEAMVEIASAFLPAGKSIGRFTNRAGRIALEPHTRSRQLYAADAVTRFNAPVIILTGERTSSAAEIFAATLRESNRARIIGTSTCGCVLAIRRRHILPDGGALDISEMDYRTGAGTRLEGAGVVPDEKIEVERKDLRDGHDRALEHAMKSLKSNTRFALL